MEKRVHRYKDNVILVLSKGTGETFGVAANRNPHIRSSALNFTVDSDESGMFVDVNVGYCEIPSFVNLDVMKLSDNEIDAIFGTLESSASRFFEKSRMPMVYFHTFNELINGDIKKTNKLMHCDRIRKFLPFIEGTIGSVEESHFSDLCSHLLSTYNIDLKDKKIIERAISFQLRKEHDRLAKMPPLWKDFDGDQVPRIELFKDK